MVDRTRETHVVSAEKAPVTQDLGSSRALGSPAAHGFNGFDLEQPLGRPDTTTLGLGRTTWNPRNP